MARDANAQTAREQLVSLGAETMHVHVQRDDAAATAPPDAQLGAYPITGTLGAGGMGQVLQVHDEDIGREMAAKVILGNADRASLSKFVLEARVTGQLEHPNIPPVHAIGVTADGRAYFTMKRVEGQDLAAILDRLRAGADAPRLPELLRIFDKVCDAIGFAHSRGVIHRDLKPANIMVGAFGEVQVMDWGLAKVKGAADPAVRGCVPQASGRIAQQLGEEATPLRTLDGAIMGTPAYMPPEQARGLVDEIDERSDVYALGAILYELLCQRPPFVGSTTWEVLLQVGEGQTVPPSERCAEPIPWELEAVVTRAMSFAREDRYPSALALRDEILRYLDGRALSAARYTIGQQAVRWARRHRVAVAGVAAVLGTALIAGALTRVASRRALERQVDRAMARARDREAGLPSPDDMRQALTRREGARAPGSGARADPRWERALAGYLDVVSAIDRALSVAPDRAAPRAARRRAGEALGLAAQLTQDYTLARRAISDLRTWGASAAETARLTRALEHRQALQRRWRAARLGRMLTDLQRGLQARERAFPHWTLDDYVVEAVTYRDEQTAVMLGAALAELPAAGHDDAQRLRAQFCCRVLSRIGLPSAVQQLLRWTARVRDERLAVEAGIALCITESPRAYAALLALRDRLGINSPHWARISDLFRRVPAPRGADAQPEEGDVAQRVSKAMTLMERGELRAARARLDALVERHPDDWRTWCSRGTVRVAAGDPAGGRGDLERAVALAPASADAHFNLANVLHALCEWDDAARAFERALQLRPGDVRFLVHQSKTLLRLGRLQDARRGIERALARAPRHALAIAIRGELRRLIDGDIGGAVADYRRALELDSRLVTAHRALANALAESKRFAEAMASIGRALELDPRSAETYHIRGVIQSLQRRDELALADFARALELRPRHVRARIERAVILKTRRRYRDALAELDRALALDPRAARGYEARATVQLALGQPKRAAADARRAVELAPRQADSWLCLGIALEQLGQADDSMKALNRALALDPTLSAAYNARGVRYFKAEQLERAIAEFSRAIEQDDRNVQALLNRAQALRERRQFEGVIRDAQRAQTLAPGNALAYRLSGIAYAALARFPEAARDCERALKLDPSPWHIWELLGKIRKAQGQRRAAIAALERALALAPERSKGRVAAVLAALRAGR